MIVKKRRLKKRFSLTHWGCLSHKLVASVGSGHCWFVYLLFIYSNSPYHHWYSSNWNGLTQYMNKSSYSIFAKWCVTNTWTYIGWPSYYGFQRLGEKRGMQLTSCKTHLKWHNICKRLLLTRRDSCTVYIHTMRNIAILGFTHAAGMANASPPTPEWRGCVMIIAISLYQL